MKIMRLKEYALTFKSHKLLSILICIGVFVSACLISFADDTGLNIFGLSTVKSLDASGYGNFEPYYDTLNCEYLSKKLIYRKNLKDINCSIQTECGLFEFGISYLPGIFGGYWTDTAWIKGQIFRECPSSIKDTVLRGRAQQLSQGD